MDTQTSGRIYDELTATVGLRLTNVGMTIDADDVPTLATDQERDSGIFVSVLLGRLVVDRGDLPAIRTAAEAQDDRIRSLLSLEESADAATAAVQTRDLQDAQERRRLLDGFLCDDRAAMLHAYERIMSLARK
jgi:hypothetical protein